MISLRLRAASIAVFFSAAAPGGAWAQSDAPVATEPTQAAPAQRGAGGPAAAQGAGQRPVTAPAPRRPDAVTRHTATIAGASIAYTATVGALPVADQAGVVKANFVYTSYVKDGGGDRPLTFAFNGGPGIASAYLHLGALGPKMLVVNDDGTLVGAPTSLTANPQSWLAFTDLVFVDPIGTGFSRPALVDGKPAPNSDFWGVEQDVSWAARFVRQYLTQAKRWGSPKFLVGESYGGFRVARMAQALEGDFGVQLNGVIMVSPLIEYGLSFGNERNELWPAVLRLPSFAAIAWNYGRLGDGPRTPAARDAMRSEVENFALSEMLPALAQGYALPMDKRSALYARIARYSGVAAELVQRADGRLGREVFLKEVLRSEGKVIGRYDGSVNVADQNPGSPFFNEPDPTYQGVATPLLSAMNTYLQGDLQVSEERTYILANTAATNQWDWRVRRRDGNAVGSIGELRSAMIGNPALRVMVAHGRFDLVTPYFASQYTLNQMQLDPGLRKNLEFRLYDGGHMMYLHKASREQLYVDAAAFYAAPGRRME